MLEIIERTISFLASSRKGYDDQLITRQPLFSKVSSPRITVTSELGPSNVLIDAQYTGDGPGTLPSLSWTLPPSIPSDSISGFVFFCEDPDAPIGCILHSAIYGIPPTATKLTEADLEKAGEGELKIGYRYATNRRNNVYIPPRPLKGHGVHRYFYSIAALGKGDDKVELAPLATKEEVLQMCERKGILGWGEWVANAERK